jgi:RHS repeat-associated protein
VTPTGGRVTSRRDQMTYPDGTEVGYSYGSSGSIADTAVRVDKMTQAKVDLATYDYLGAGQVVTTTLNEAGTSSTVFNSGSTTYPDYDNFNRVIESIWKRAIPFYDETIAYDRDSGITSGVDAVLTDISGNHQFDAVYTNDNLNRLLEAKEGNPTTGSISTCLRDEQWTLSQTGNWAVRKMDLNGDLDFTDSGELNDTGTFDAANKWLTRDTDSNSSVNYTLAYDGNGSMTDDGQSYKYVWDAFGRLVTVNNQSNALVAEFRYNGYGYKLGDHTDVTRSGGGAPNGTTDSYDPWYYFCYDDRWRPVAVYRDTDTNTHVKTRTVYHNAGANGLGGSSYIDLVVLRDRDADTNWYDAADTAAEERIYYCQNAHADVVVVTTAAGLPIENIRYSAYGRPSSYALADLNHDGVINGTGTGTDYAGYFAIQSGSGGNADTNFDGNWGTSGDDTAFFDSYSTPSTGGVGVLSRALTDNRIGCAGYRYNPAIGLYDVRHRDYDPKIGRWLSRDNLRDREDISLYAYSSNDPLDRSDPLGLLSIETLPQSANGLCGSYNVEWKFRLNHPARFSGYIIQHIQRGGGGIGINPAYPVEATFMDEYWEAWYIDQGHDDNNLDQIIGYTDSSSHGFWPGSGGGRYAAGEIRFFRTGDVGVLENDPLWNPPYSHPSSLDLPSTTVAPRFWDSSYDLEESYALRSVSINWWCSDINFPTMNVPFRVEPPYIPTPPPPPPVNPAPHAFAVAPCPNCW